MTSRRGEKASPAQGRVSGGDSASRGVAAQGNGSAKGPAKKSRKAPGAGGPAFGGVDPAMEVLVDVKDVAYGGAGVGRVDGMVVFTPFAMPGETLRVRLTKRTKNFAEGEVLSIESASEHRLKAPCPYFERCGGCAYQHVPYEMQLEWKSLQVRDLLRRIGRIPDPAVGPTVPSPETFAYRNRVRVHVDGARVGFFRRAGREIVDVKECLLASPEVNALLSKLRASKPVPGEYTLSARPGVRFFEQTNDGAARGLVRIVEGLVGKGGGLLVDAYCGAGFFGRTLAGLFEQVVGIETHEGAVAAAKRGAGPNERYICGDVAEYLAQVLEVSDRKRTVVLLDPPAAGVSGRVVDYLLGAPVAQVVYVSCDPATLARDVGALVKGGYVLQSVTPLDMFPQTADIEAVASLRWVG